MVRVQLEGANPQRTAARGEQLQGPVMPERLLETAPWSSSPGDGRDRPGETRTAQKSTDLIRYRAAGSHQITMRLTEEVKLKKKKGSLSCEVCGSISKTVNDVG